MVKQNALPPPDMATRRCLSFRRFRSRHGLTLAWGHALFPPDKADGCKARCFGRHWVKGGGGSPVHSRHGVGGSSVLGCEATGTPVLSLSLFSSAVCFPLGMKKQHPSTKKWELRTAFPFGQWLVERSACFAIGLTCWSSVGNEGMPRMYPDRHAGSRSPRGSSLPPENLLVREMQGMRHGMTPLQTIQLVVFFFRGPLH